MAQVPSIIIFIIFVFLEVFGVASVSQPCPTIESVKKCIYKCCPRGQYPKPKTCQPHPKVVDFSTLNVYDKELQKTGQNVQDIFTVMDGGKFVEEPGFQNSSVNRNSVGFSTYILENGDLQLVKSNVYHRWITVPNKDFCIDYVVTRKGSLTKEPKVFAFVVGEDSGENFSGNATYYAVARWISCVFLLLVLVVYTLLPELRNLGGLILMNYVSTLFVAFLLLAIIMLGPTSASCVILTLGIYYSFLASFCWMSVMSYDIWWTFRGYAKARQIHRRGERFKLAMYCLYAYGVPLLMTIFLYVLIKTDMSHLPWFIIPWRSESCFLQGPPLMLYFYTPMLILIIFNWLFYVMTAFNMWRLTRGTAILDAAAAGTPAAHRTQRRRFIVYLKLSVVMGLSWLFEIISYLSPQFNIWWIIDTYNMLIGLLIFFIFVCKKKIYKKLYKRCALPKTSRFHPSYSRSYSSSSSDARPETVSLQVCGNPKGQSIYLGTTQNK